MRIVAWLGLIKPIAIVFVFASLAFAPISVRADERSFGLINRLRGEDPSCDVLNRAYEKTLNTGRYSFTLHEVKPDGTLMPAFLEQRMRQRSIYIDWGDGKWQLYFRPYLTTIEGRSPVFRDCRYVDSETIAGAKVLHYSGHWSRDRWTAAGDVWISVDGGKFLRAQRIYAPEHSQFAFATVMEIFDYSLEKVSAPPSPQGPDCRRSQVALQIAQPDDLKAACFRYNN